MDPHHPDIPRWPKMIPTLPESCSGTSRKLWVNRPGHPFLWLDLFSALSLQDSTLQALTCGSCSYLGREKSMDPPKMGKKQPPFGKVKIRDLQILGSKGHGLNHLAIVDHNPYIVYMGSFSSLIYPSNGLLYPLKPPTRTKFSSTPSIQPIFDASWSRSVDITMVVVSLSQQLKLT